ncbi:MAG: hypothetical protein ACREMQ_21860, partial [Longimicrobiales bacterium]
MSSRTQTASDANAVAPESPIATSTVRDPAGIGCDTDAGSASARSYVVIFERKNPASATAAFNA